MGNGGDESREHAHEETEPEAGPKGCVGRFPVATHDIEDREKQRQAAERLDEEFVAQAIECEGADGDAEKSAGQERLDVRPIPFFPVWFERGGVAEQEQGEHPADGGFVLEEEGEEGTDENAQSAAKASFGDADEKGGKGKRPEMDRGVDRRISRVRGRSAVIQSSPRDRGRLDADREGWRIDREIVGRGSTIEPGRLRGRFRRPHNFRSRNRRSPGRHTCSRSRVAEFHNGHRIGNRKCRVLGSSVGSLRARQAEPAPGRGAEVVA